MNTAKRMAELTRGILTIKSEQLNYVRCKNTKERQTVAERIVSLLVECVMRNSDLIQDQSSIDSFSKALDIWNAIIKDLRRQHSITN